MGRSFQPRTTVGSCTGSTSCRPGGSRAFGWAVNIWREPVPAKIENEGFCSAPSCCTSHSHVSTLVYSWMGNAGSKVVSFESSVRYRGVHGSVSGQVNALKTPLGPNGLLNNRLAPGSHILSASLRGTTCGAVSLVAVTKGMLLKTSTATQR